MFTCSVDAEASAMVQVHWPGPIQEASFLRGLATFADLGRDTRRRVRLVVQVMDGAPPLTPQQRKTVSEVNRAAASAAIAVVTTSAVHRGIVTAVSWMDPGLRGRFTACASFDEACRWQERTTGESSAVLRRLLAEAERQGIRRL